MGREGIPRIDQHAYHLEDQPSLPPDFLARGRVPEVIEAVRIMKAEAGDQVAVMGNIVGPFSIIANLIGITDVLKRSYRKPDSLVPFLEVAEEAGTSLALAMAEAGADIIVIEDMMASIDVISPDIYKRVAQPFEKRQVARLRDLPTILHICGALNPIIADVADTGATAISMDPKVDAISARAVLDGFDRPIPMIGGVDTTVTLYEGTPEAVKADVRKALAEGYTIIAPGCSIPPSTYNENLRAMVEASKEAAV
jgi:[methyl-Co(III) methanol-specific corrinoid protein]:coenzyme M methyltransferase